LFDFSDFPSESRYALTKVALGEAEADLAITHGDVVNVYTAEIVRNQTILIKHDRIAYVGQNTSSSIGPHTKVIGASGKTVIPGLIDGHTHMDYLASTPEVVKYALKTGTTSIISETAQLSCSLGYRGVTEYLKSVRHQPIKFWITLPPMVSISPIFKQHIVTLKQVKRLLRRREVVGLGEVYWAPLLAGDKPQMDFICETVKAGKKVEGHSAGASANKLQAYAGLGITSDHEPTTSEEALERLRLGLSVMIREGEVRRDLERVSRIKEENLDFRRLSVSTDGIGPLQLTTDGFMDYLVQRCINLGFPPVQAIQMATLNVAEHFKLEDLVGGIAPGKSADILIIPELTKIKPETVISNGQIVFQNGEIIVPPRQHSYPAFMYKTLIVGRHFQALDFAVPCQTKARTLKVRVIDQVTNLLTREAILQLPTINGQVGMDPSSGVIKVAAVERLHSPGKTFTGFIRGIGLKRGAIATSTCWDASDINIVGADEADMAVAVNRIQELQGGTVICLDGEIVAEQSFPVGGMISTEPMEKLAANLRYLQAKAQELGCTSPDIRTTLSILTTAAIPYLRICESGLFNLRSNSPADLVIG
jgi:adenine deaminase